MALETPDLWDDILGDIVDRRDRAPHPVARNVSRLLNTRSVVDATTLAAFKVEGTVLGYGIPDGKLTATHFPAGKKVLQTAIVDALARFEPRLTDVRVSVGTQDRMGWNAENYILIDGQLSDRSDDYLELTGHLGGPSQNLKIETEAEGT